MIADGKTVCPVAVADALLKGISFEQSLRYWCLKYPTPKGGNGGSFWLFLSAEIVTPLLQ